jgi:hypothetical protein
MDIWDMNKQEVIDYLRPKFDVTTGKKMRKAGALERIKDVEVPTEILNDIDRFEDGVEYIKLDKAIVIPVKENKIDWEKIK